MTGIIVSRFAKRGASADIIQTGKTYVLVMHGRNALTLPYRTLAEAQQAANFFFPKKKSRKRS